MASTSGRLLKGTGISSLTLFTCHKMKGYVLYNLTVWVFVWSSIRSFSYLLISIHHLKYCHMFQCDCRWGFGWVIWFIYHLYMQLITASNYNSLTGFYIIKISVTAAHTNYSVPSLVISSYYNLAASTAYVLAVWRIFHDWLITPILSCL
jgi:hypothetical protein